MNTSHSPGRLPGMQSWDGGRVRLCPIVSGRFFFEIDRNTVENGLLVSRMKFQDFPLDVPTLIMFMLAREKGVARKTASYEGAAPPFYFSIFPFSRFPFSFSFSICDLFNGPTSSESGSAKYFMIIRP